MKKWMKAPKSPAPSKPDARRPTTVRTQLRKLIEGLELEELLRTQYQKKQEPYFFQKCSYV